MRFFCLRCVLSEERPEVGMSAGVPSLEEGRAYSEALVGAGDAEKPS